MLEGKLNRVAAIGAACALALACAVALTGCFGGGSVGGEWLFKSIAPTEQKLAEAGDDAAKADVEAEASMLSVFLSDSTVRFADEGQFTFTFLGEPYQGKWAGEGGGARVEMPEGDASSGAGTYRLDGNELVFTADEGAGRLEGFEVRFQRLEDVKAGMETTVVEDASASDEAPVENDSEVVDDSAVGVEDDEATSSEGQ